MAENDQTSSKKKKRKEMYHKVGFHLFIDEIHLFFFKLFTFQPNNLKYIMVEVTQFTFRSTVNHCRSVEIRSHQCPKTRTK